MRRTFEKKHGINWYTFFILRAAWTDGLLAICIANLLFLIEATGFIFFTATVTGSFKGFTLAILVNRSLSEILLELGSKILDGGLVTDIFFFSGLFLSLSAFFFYFNFLSWKKKLMIRNIFSCLIKQWYINGFAIY